MFYISCTCTKFIQIWYTSMLMMMPRNAKKSKLLELIGVENLKDATAKQFGAFVDYDQKPDDGGWLTTAMELNLIKDVVNIGNRYSDNIKQIADGRYFSEDGSSHNVFELSGDLGFELGCRGKLGDSCKDDEYRKLRDFFWNKV